VGDATLKALLVSGGLGNGADDGAARNAASQKVEQALTLWRGSRALQHLPRVHSRVHGLAEAGRSGAADAAAQTARRSLSGSMDAFHLFFAALDAAAVHAPM
jgi:hypothetical protein